VTGTASWLFHKLAHSQADPAGELVRSAAGSNMSEAFQTDPRIAEIAAAYSLDALDLAANNFGMSLDWSDESIRNVEEILGRLHDDVARSNPPDDAIWTFAKAFGSYVGEVLRRHHGAEWGMVRMGTESFPGLQ
jgi:hypothetical protein